ncbi:hypothetical protein ACFSHP_06980 [Novosphingobium panipatense]
MSHPVEHDLRDRALACVGLTRRFIVDRRREALERAGAIDAGPVDKEGAGERQRAACPIVRVRMDALADLQRARLRFKIVEGGARKTCTGLLERHRLRVRFGKRGVSDGEAPQSSPHSSGAAKAGSATVMAAVMT